MNTPEKLNLWDRLFNRYKNIVISEGTETWCQRRYGMRVPNTDYPRLFVKYKRIDRVTGSEEIFKKYI